MGESWNTLRGGEVQTKNPSSPFPAGIVSRPCIDFIALASNLDHTKLLEVEQN